MGAYPRLLPDRITPEEIWKKFEKTNAYNISPRS